MILCPVFTANAQLRDSLTRARWYFRSSAAFSVTGQENWYGSSAGAISLSGSFDLKYRKKKDKRISEHRFRGDLGFLKPDNQPWSKSNDQLRLQFQWIKYSEAKWYTSYSAKLFTQWLSTWKINPEKTNSEIWYGGFMNPFSFDFSFDFTKSLLNNSRLHVSLATVSVTAVPLKRSLPGEESAVFVTDHSLIRSRYGCSLQLMMDEKFRNNTILLDHSSFIVANAISAEGVRAEIQNRISFKLFRHIQLRFDTRILYDPDFSLKMQYRQEVLLGIFYEAGP
jgi:hypothetical protein